MYIRSAPTAKNQSIYAATQLHLTYLGNMSSEDWIASILVVAMFSALKFFDEGNRTFEVVNANVSTVIACVELWVLSLVSHWKQRRYLDQRAATINRTSVWQSGPTLKLARIVCIRLSKTGPVLQCRCLTPVTRLTTPARGLAPCGTRALVGDK